ncbi:hypothetical protein J5500_03575 [Candidatus Saccharibacteria bacterium]|nr:hypothetical protein [Candidatus Saccharibacteria bacterium]
MKILRKKRAEGEPKQPERRRHDFDETYRVGRTYAGDAQKTREDKMARAADRKKRDIKNIATVVGIVLIVVLVIVVVANYVTSIIAEREASIAPAQPLEPTVTIVDENLGDNISRRVKDFVAHLEDDVASYYMKIDHVTLPLQKAREVDVFIVGRDEYYKMSLDRDSAMQAEDLYRMSLYLDQKELHPGYVDLRVEGKAYYK